MSKNTTLFVTKTFVKTITVVANADASADKTIYNAGANGSIAYDIMISSTDTTDRLFNLKMNGTFVASFMVLAGTGTNTTPPVTIGQLLPGFLRNDMAGNKMLGLESGDSLTVNCTTTVTSGKVVTFLVKSEDY